MMFFKVLDSKSELTLEIESEIMGFQTMQFNILLGARRPHWPIDYFKAMNSQSFLDLELPFPAIPFGQLGIPEHSYLELSLQYTPPDPVSPVAFDDEVIYVFLEYYSKFNRDKFGISIDGPVNLSLLPDIVVENPAHHALFGGQFLRELINLYTVPCKIPAENRPPFMRKVVNIIDPLKTNNNLGRSVNIGNRLRITIVFGLGAGKLAEILELPREEIKVGIKDFLGNTLKMNKSKFTLKPQLTSDSLLTDCSNEDDIQMDDLNADLECDNLNLTDLLGDLNGNLRSLLSSQCTLGFPYSAGDHRLAVQSYPITGSVMHPAPNLQVHRTGPLSRLPMGPSTRASGRGRLLPLHVSPLNWGYGTTFDIGSSSGATNNFPEPQSTQGGHGQSNAPSRVPTRERRLVFGSFGRGSMTSPKPEQTILYLDALEDRTKALYRSWMNTSSLMFIELSKEDEMQHV